MAIDKFIWETGDMVVAPCVTCKHKGNGATCTAFPKGIPDAILSGKDKHTKPFPGDHGIQFEPVQNG